MQKNVLLALGLVVALAAFSAAAYTLGTLHPLTNPAAQPDAQLSDSTTSTATGKLMSIDSYVTQNITTLSPVKATMGGTFYVTNLEAQNGTGTVAYEDGHNNYVADFAYTTADSSTGAGGYTVTSFTVRP